MRVTLAIPVAFSIPLAGRDVHLMTISTNEAVTSVDPVHLSTKNDAIDLQSVDPVHHAHIPRMLAMEPGRYGHQVHSRRGARVRASEPRS